LISFKKRRRKLSSNLEVWKSIKMSFPFLIFFQFWPFYIHILRNEAGQNFFSNLTLLSHVSSVGVTYEGVVPYVLTRLIRLARAELVMWRHVGFSRAGPCGATESRHLLWRNSRPSRQVRVSISRARARGVTQSHQSVWRDWP
jgi:hypothetical protein